LLMYDYDQIHKYGYVPIGELSNMIVEAITQLATLGKGRTEISRILRMSRNTLNQYIDEHNIQVIDARSTLKTKPRKLLGRTIEEYQELCKTYNNAEICELWDTNMVTLRIWRKEQGLTIRKGNIR